MPSSVPGMGVGALAPTVHTNRRAPLLNTSRLPSGAQLGRKTAALSRAKRRWNACEDRIQVPGRPLLSTRGLRVKSKNRPGKVMVVVTSDSGPGLPSLGETRKIAETRRGCVVRLLSGPTPQKLAQGNGSAVLRSSTDAMREPSGDGVPA